MMRSNTQMRPISMPKSSEYLLVSLIERQHRFECIRYIHSRQVYECAIFSIANSEPPTPENPLISKCRMQFRMNYSWMGRDSVSYVTEKFIFVSYQIKLLKSSNFDIVQYFTLTHFRFFLPPPPLILLISAKFSNFIWH